MKLTSERVREIFKDCLTPDMETKHIVVEGVAHSYGLKPSKLEEHREEIFALLKELPEQFMESGGGGWSFLNACMDRHGNQWTGEHLVMESLFCLGIGIDVVVNPVPEELRPLLPGWVPYYLVKDKSWKT